MQPCLYYWLSLKDPSRFKGLSGLNAHILTFPHSLIVLYKSYAQDLMSVKSLEGYTVVECDEIEGSSNVSTTGDDFTVETALEDLEFGFTVTESTQQVSVIESLCSYINYTIAMLYIQGLCMCSQIIASVSS